MLFSLLLQSYLVLHTRSARQALYTIEEDGITINFCDDNDGNDLYFAADARATFFPDDPSAFCVTDTRGNPIQFNAYIPAALERAALVDDIRTAHRDFQNAIDREGERDAQRDLDAAWQALRDFDAKGIL
jgi:hypothetical protein